MVFDPVKTGGGIYHQKSITNQPCLWSGKDKSPIIDHGFGSIGFLRTDEDAINSDHSVVHNNPKKKPRFDLQNILLFRDYCAQ